MTKIEIQSQLLIVLRQQWPCFFIRHLRSFQRQEREWLSTHPSQQKFQTDLTSNNRNNWPWASLEFLKKNKWRIFLKRCSPWRKLHTSSSASTPETAALELQSKYIPKCWRDNVCLFLSCKLTSWTFDRVDGRRLTDHQTTSQLAVWLGWGVVPFSLQKGEVPWRHENRPTSSDLTEWRYKAVQSASRVCDVTSGCRNRTGSATARNAKATNGIFRLFFSSTLTLGLSNFIAVNVHPSYKMMRTCIVDGCSVVADLWTRPGSPHCVDYALSRSTCRSQQTADLFLKNFLRVGK